MTETPTEQANGAGMPPEQPFFSGRNVAIEDELKSAYLDYAMSVIVSRAIPDLRDGLKPVHRRILHSMNETGNTSDKPYRKSARPVGDVMGKYHPHGDGAIYDALVRMAQDFSMSIMLLDGQGNFGSMDGDNPAAMRYTEVRMAKVAEMMLADIDMETVDFQDNYDGKDREPVVLPTRFPNLLVNGGGGIAVGMATNIPPHNLGEVVDATLAMIEDPDISMERLMEIIPAPDFPTGGVIQGEIGSRKAFITGRGAIRVRAKTRFEELQKDKTAIIVDEIPYQVNKADLIERIAQIAKERRIEGISHVQDLSDRTGVRIVIELKRDATPEVVLNQLWRFTALESSFHCNLLALNGGRPELLTLTSYLRSFIEFREEVVGRRTAFQLGRARERSHVLCGLAVAVSNLDEVIGIIRSSAQPADARNRLMERAWPSEEIEEYIRLIDDPSQADARDGQYRLSDAQARAILDLRLQRLTAMGVKEVTDELKKLAVQIKDYLEILRSGERIRGIIAEELREVKEAFAIPRRTSIIDDPEEIEDEDLIEREDVVVTVTNDGYIKRTPLSEFRAQRRGGKGLAGMATKQDDFVLSQHVLNTHDLLAFFTTDGMAYSLKTWRLPKGGRNARGKPIVNLLPIAGGASVAAILPLNVTKEESDSHQTVFATSAGRVRRNRLNDFTRIMSNGKRAMALREGVKLVNARICTEDDDVVLVTSKGRAVRFPAGQVRVFKDRKSNGVRGIRVQEDDHVVAMEIVPHFDASPSERAEFLKRRRAEHSSQQNGTPQGESAETDSSALSSERYEIMKAAEGILLTITEKGLGKRTSTHDYPVKNRGIRGVRVAKGGRVAAFLSVWRDDQILLASDSGQSIRCGVSDVSFQSRSSRGVRVMNLESSEKIVSVARTEVDGTVGEVNGENGEREPAHEHTQPSASANSQ